MSIVNKCVFYLIRDYEKPATCVSNKIRSGTGNKSPQFLAACIQLFQLGTPATSGWLLWTLKQHDIVEKGLLTPFTQKTIYTEKLAHVMLFRPKNLKVKKNNNNILAD